MADLKQKVDLSKVINLLKSEIIRLDKKGEALDGKVGDDIVMEKTGIAGASVALGKMLEKIKGLE